MRFPILILVLPILLVCSICSAQVADLEFDGADIVDGCTGTYHLLDVTDDGVLDVVTVCSIDSPDGGLEIATYRGDAELEFGFDEPVISEIEEDSLLSGMAFGDVDADGNLDLVITFILTYVVLLGDGAGGFTEEFSPTVPAFNFRVHAADLDGDGYDDLIIGSFTGIRIHLSDGTGAFDAGEEEEASLAGSPTAIEVRDFDDDGAPDIIVSGGAGIVVFFTDGDGAVEETAEYELFGPATETQFSGRMVVADLNDDESLDLAYLRNSERIEVMLGDSSRDLPEPEVYEPDDDTLLLDLDPGDMDDDGDLDLVVVGVGYGSPGVPYTRAETFIILENDGEGVFDEEAAFDYPEDAENGFQVMVRDLDGDCDPDVAIVNNEFVEIGENPDGVEIGIGGPVRLELLENTLETSCPEDTAPEFLRGDATGDGRVVAIPDALFIFRYGFLDGAEPDCLDAADVNDDGEVSALPDGLALLSWQFTEGDPPADPGPEECGIDPDPEDDLGCMATSKECQ